MSRAEEIEMQIQALQAERDGLEDEEEEAPEPVAETQEPQTQPDVGKARAAADAAYAEELARTNNPRTAMQKQRDVFEQELRKTGVGFTTDVTPLAPVRVPTGNAEDFRSEMRQAKTQAEIDAIFAKYGMRPPSLSPHRMVH